MMKECALHTFLSMPKERQTVYRGRLGIWYEDHRLYLHAMTEYRQNGDYDAMLRTLQKDAGILLSSLHPKAVLAALDECPAAVLASHPLAILVLMRSMFNWRNIPKMLELKELLLTAISENTALSAQEKGDLRGEWRPDHELSLLQRYQRHEPPAPECQRADVAEGDQHPVRRRLDLRFTVCADDVLPRTGRAAERAC